MGLAGRPERRHKTTVQRCLNSPEERNIRTETFRATNKGYFTVSEPCAMINTREQDQQDAHFSLIIYFNESIIDMFGTNNCSLSGGLYKQLRVCHRACL